MEGWVDGWESLLVTCKLWLVVMADDENYLYIFSLQPGAESASKHLLSLSSPDL